MDDNKVRLAAFKWLEEQTAIHGDVLPRRLLADGFTLDGQRIPLVSAQGIFKPKVLSEIPLSITTTAKSPYKDRVGPEGHIIYSYRGNNPQHRENVGLRNAWKRGIPLIYFHGLVPGKYYAVWPVYVVGDNPLGLEFKVLVDDKRYVNRAREMMTTDSIVLRDQEEGRREYITAIVRQRLHQQSFRERVLEAYHQQCAMCRLRHVELLDAAHIIPDGQPGGEPVVSNGLSLCKLHHAAFDSFFVGIRPDFVMEIRKGILDEEDGPMLLHGLKGLHGKQIWIPRASRIQPDTERLKIRYGRFMTESGEESGASDSLV
jgi:putative restriction endonuclease